MNVRVPPAPRVIVATETIVDAHAVRAIERALRAVTAGSLAVLFRDTRDAGGPIFREVLAIARAHGAPLFAKAPRSPDADGAHLGGGPWDKKYVHNARARGAWLSVAAHEDEDVARAKAFGATAVLVSPIYETLKKRAPRGISAISRAIEIANGELLVYALGGVHEENARACIEAGACGVCVIRAVLSAADPGAAAARLVAVVSTPERC